MQEPIASDYLVVGAGGMGMAFTDEIVSQTSKTVTIVDRYHRPGGHWNDAYSHVRLHQATVTYGVNSTAMGKDVIDQFGWNKGCNQLAGGSQVLAYFDGVMRDTFLPSGRVRYLPMCEYLGPQGVVSRVSGADYSVKAKKIVDATYMNVTVPAQRPPKFVVEQGARSIPPNDLPRAAVEHKHFVIVGAGKTGMDACLFLLEIGVDPAAITWVMPNDSYVFDRRSVNPGRKLTDPILTGRMEVLNAVFEATSLDDFFQRVVDYGQLLQFDPGVRPTHFRCATVTKMELEQLRRISNIVRLGRVESVSPDHMTLTGGTIETPPQAVYVDCAADGLEQRPARPVFDGNRITLQSVRMCQQIYSAALTAHVETHFADEQRKNELCRPVPHPYLAEDYLRVAILDSENMLEWMSEPSIVEWINGARIDLFSPIIDFDDPDVAPQLEKMGELMAASIPKMRELLESTVALTD